MGNTIYSSSPSSEHSRKNTNTVIYISKKSAPAHHAQKPANKMTQLKQPKKAGLFQTKKSTTPVAPQSEVDRIIAGMKCNA